MNFAKTIEACNNHKARGKGDIALKKIQNFIRKSKSEIKAYIYAAEYAESCKKNTLAENYYQEAIKKNPDDAYFYLNYARFKIRTNRFHESKPLFEKAYSLNNSSDLILTQLGRINLILGNTTQGFKFLNKAIEINPNNFQAIYLLAIGNLKMGNYAKGWELFKYRHLHLKGAELGWGKVDTNFFTLGNKWNNEDLTNKTLLIMPEQGLGDFIMLFRYIRLIRDRYKCFINLICNPSLCRLFSNTNLIDNISSTDEPVEFRDNPFDYWITIFDLPIIFSNHSVGKFNFPYIDLKATRKNYDFISKENINIGFVWRGSKNHSNDHYRSIKDRNLLIDFLSQEKVNFISLQYDITNEEEKLLGDYIFSTKGMVKDFEDTANIVTCLDLVISVDTSVVHLAGALNIPCWVMLPDLEADWRWLEKTSKTLWYQSLKIFRNNNEEGWPHLINQVRLELKELL